MSFGFGFSPTSWQAISRGFNPASLFQAGEVGTWYDPSDITTLYQDSAGTTPVTAVEQPVGLMLDKSKGVSTNPILQKYGSLPGTSGSYFSTTDSAANSVTGDIDISVLVALPQVPPSAVTQLVSKWTSTAGSNLSYNLNIRNSTGKIEFNISTTGSNYFGVTSTSGISGTASVPIWLRVTRVASSGLVSFYQSTDGTSWSSLGTATLQAGSNIYDSGAILCVGASLSSSEYANAKIYRAQIYNGIAGSLAVDFCPPFGWSSGTWTASTSEVWTVNGSATVVSLTTSGNHAFQATPANRPTLSARVNLRDHSEAILIANGYGTVSATLTQVSISTPTTNVASKLVLDNGASTGNANTGCTFGNISLTNSTQHTQSIYAKAAGSNVLRLRNNATGGTADFVLTGNGTAPGAGIGIQSASILFVSDGWYRCSWTFTTTTSAPGNRFDCFILKTDVNDGVGGIYISGADLRVANDGVNIPTYQRVNTSTDYDTTGFPTYLSFNGSNSCMATNSIDFSATDKMTVWAGVRKLSDSSTGAIAELSSSSASYNGAFLLANGYSNATNWDFSSKGTLVSNAVTSNTYTPPLTNILTGSGSISTDEVTLSVNGSKVATSSADQGTGNFGNYPIYIGARAGTGTWFTGRLYGLVVRGAQSTAAQIASTETYLNQKTRAY